MRRYETMMVLHPDLPEAQTRETIERARQLLRGMGAEIYETDEWGMRDLAYPIQKVRRGYYVVLEYAAEPAAVNELERTLRLADEVLRYITVARSNMRRRASAATKRSREEKREPQDGRASRDLPEHGDPENALSFGDDEENNVRFDEGRGGRGEGDDCLLEARKPADGAEVHEERTS